MKHHQLIAALITAQCFVSVTVANPDPGSEARLPIMGMFPLGDVRLLDPELIRIQDLNRKYLLGLNPDHLLRNYRENAGIHTGIPELSGHERSTGPHGIVRGHYTGHYLSACAMMIASVGDQALKAKADGIVDELAKLQQPNGYLSAQPESVFDELEADPGGRRIPWYVQHKLMAGLLDMYVHAGNEKALEVAKKLGDWVVARTGKIDRELMQRILKREFGGMGEAMANLAAISHDRRYLEAARRFDQEEVLRPLAAGKDNLTQRHGNTVIPKLIAAARLHELTDETHYRDAASFFWRQVALHRSYATGGNTISEHFATPPDVLSKSLGPTTQESCNTYNMLKLTEHVFRWNPDALAGDYYERALYNHILATPHPDNAMPLYFLGLSPGQWKVHFTPNDSFWCCAGTGLENFSKLQHGIYYQHGNRLWVNLFIASELRWKEKGVKVHQKTSFPDEPQTTFLIDPEQPTAFSLHIRIPHWADNPSIEINGEKFGDGLMPGFAALERVWKSGDTVTVRLPMRLHLQPMPDDPNLAAIMYGPLVLAGELGPVSKEKVFSPENKHNRMFDHQPYVEAGRLGLTGVSEPIQKWMEPVAGRSLTFRTKEVGRPHDFTLSPLFRMFEQRYNVYWRLLPESAEDLKRN